jgi:hypothetical protein
MSARCKCSKISKILANGLELWLPPVYELDYLQHCQTNVVALPDSLSFVSK